MKLVVLLLAAAFFIGFRFAVGPWVRASARRRLTAWGAGRFYVAMYLGLFLAGFAGAYVLNLFGAGVIALTEDELTLFTAHVSDVSRTLKLLVPAALICVLSAVDLPLRAVGRLRSSGWEAREAGFYRQALAELRENRVDEATFARAYSEASGRDERTRALYIRHRVEQLRNAAERDAAHV